jgi:hypothetical protein
MTNLQPGGIEQAIDYCKYQSNKGIDSLVALMQRTAADWQRNLRGLSEAQATFAPPGEWSSRDVVNHFLEVTVGVNGQIRRFTSAGIMPSTTDEGELTAQGKARVAQTPEDMSNLIAELFDDIVLLTHSLENSENLDKTFPHPVFGSLNILEWTAFQRLHGMDHMQQIDKNKADPAYPTA